MGQEPTSGVIQGLAIAESVVAREEAVSRRAFDPSFRARAKELLATLPLAELESQTGEGGLGLNILGDSQADLVYTPVTPCRIIDTRMAGGALAVGTPRSFLVTGTDYSAQGGSPTGCGVPYGPATAAVVNLTAVDAAGLGHLRITPFGSAMPLAAIVNYTTGLTIANGPAVALCDPSAATCTSDITIEARGSATHFVADVQGYFRSVATGGVGTALLANSAVTAPKIGNGVVVRSLNSQTDAVTLAGSNGLSVSQGSGTVTVSSNATATNTAGAIVARDGTGSFLAGSIGLAGNLVLSNTTSASVGVLTKGGTPFLHNFGANNTFVGAGAGNLTLTGARISAFGYAALSQNTTGNDNSAFGNLALLSNTTGYFNSAFGSNALYANTTGYFNSAFGLAALQRNTTGNYNSAFGMSALANTTTGHWNSAFGYLALSSNTTGNNNAAFGNSALAQNTTGYDNAAFGPGALQNNTTGFYNSAFGFQALSLNTTASYNTAVGYQTLLSNTTGYANVAVGNHALGANTTGNDNAAFGYRALTANTTGPYNSAFGNRALEANTGGYYNSAFGYQALVSNTTASQNSAFGYQALNANTTGYYNSAFGYQALYANTTSLGNTAFGWMALADVADGAINTAVGADALRHLSVGYGNTAIGSVAGSNLISGNYNIYIDNQGGASSELGMIRIGDDAHQAATYIAGIYGKTSAAGVAVYANSSGKLGTAISSRRYKEQIADMDAESDVLLKLRPVSFYYRPDLDETHTRQYGLVAEEVAELAPELVVRDEKGAPQAVRYHFVNAMLLNELQKQRRQLEAQEGQLREQDAEIRELRAQEAEIGELRASLARLEARLPQ